MTEPLRVLHIFGRMQRGGAELRTLDMMRHVDRSRFRLDFCALSGLPGELDGAVRELGGEVLPCRLGWGFAGRFRRLLRGGGYRVVHSHVHLASGYVLRQAARAGVPVRVAHFRSTGDGRPDSPRRRLQRRLMRTWLDRHATAILAVSRGTMDGAWGPDWGRDPRCRVVYSGLDRSPFAAPVDAAAVRRELGLPSAGPLLVHVGNLLPDKNHARLLDVFASLRRRQPAASLLLVGRGGGPVEAELRARLAADPDLAARVVLAGVRPDVPRLLGAADLFVFPSRREGLPGVVLEACAAGAPVLASDLPGVLEIAAAFPTVRALPLAADDGCWADAAAALLAAGRVVPEAVAARFAASPFGMDGCVAAHAAVWEGGA